MENGSSVSRGGDRRSSAGYDAAALNMAAELQQLRFSPPPASMAPPQTTRGSGSSSGYTSMTGAGYALQGVDHPPSKSATGGQSHAHRPVSAMPMVTGHSHHSSSRQADASVLNPINNTVYADRRASAHPTMSTPSSHHSMAPPLPISPNGSVLDAATSGAISNGIPVTSPAALQYFAAHPRRQQVHFGNYLLLQTLGEGEFGKVKLGVHKEWGEEVAVKLIKRDKVGTPDGQLLITGPSKDPSKMSKVEKEIRVLKDVRHPNIVRLYEVIESDRYIGIVLEYASGGELFDHILAHKYLKERDACRLFAQLISGVSYLHQKKIVHRDLKLENLLLDRNRNVIITDFGFANNFENRKDDLMATSCGSPCYAAPELVVQDGLYAGSAVDVWSCGVILYAMLAGYLPYDDDPKNPEGDNINLLYKYIMATPLSFPEYITAEPRDLLGKMLVPDPTRRADLDTVMQHPWLAPYRDLFRFTVDDLERAAIEQQNKKRMVYRQQMMLQQQLAEQQAGRNGRAAPLSDASAVKQARHQSAVATSTTMPDRIHDPAIPSARSRPVTGLPTPIVPAEPMPVLERESSQSSKYHNSSGAPSSSTSSSKKSAGQKTQRHTVQLEYTGDTINSDKRRDQDNKATSQKAHTEQIASTAIPPVPKVPWVDSGSSMDAAAIKSDHSTPSNATSASSADVAYVPATPIVIPAAEQRTSSNIKANKATNGSAHAELDRTNGISSNGQRVTSNPLPPPTPSVTGDMASNRVVSGGAGPRPEPRQSQSSSQANATPMTPSKSAQVAAEKRGSRHRKGMSTDKFFSRLMTSSSNEPTPSTPSRPVTAVARDTTPSIHESLATPPTKEENGRKTSGSRRKAMSLVVGRYAEPSTPTAKEREKAANKAAKEERRLTGRLRKETLTSKFDTPKRAPIETPAREPSRNLSPSANSVLTTSASSRPGTSRSGQTAGGDALFEGRSNESSSTVGPSSNAAKKVMDWFRKKSLSPRGGFEDKPPLGLFDLQQQQSQGSKSSRQGESPPRLIVTNDAGKSQERVEILTSSALDGGIDSVPSSRSTSGTHSQASHATDGTGLTSATETSVPHAVGGVSSSKSSTSTMQPPTQEQTTTPRASVLMGPTSAGTRPGAAIAKKDDSTLRVHQGAVDQSALTSRSPDDVLEQVRRALHEMGVEAKKEREEEYKFECVRRKRAKTLMGATQGLGLSLRTSVFPPSQAELERSGAARPPPLSPSAGGAGSGSNSNQLSTSPSTSGSLRNLLRRGSSQQGGGPSSNLQPISDDGTPTPIYGEASVDGGQEVRFSVEVTKIKNLPGLYSLDIRRMKGNLWAYKFLYHALLDRCQLGGVSPSST